MDQWYNEKYINLVEMGQWYNEKYINLVEMDQWYNEKYINFYHKTQMKTIRNRFRNEKRLEIKEYYVSCGSYRETARVFKINDSTVRNICKKDDGFRGGKARIENVKGAGRPLSYPVSVDEELVSWLLQMNDLHLPVSTLTLQKKAKSLILPHNRTDLQQAGVGFAISKTDIILLFGREHLCARSFHHHSLKVR